SALRRVTDAGSLDRGRAYARTGMVLRSAWNADFTMLAADVRGSGAATYRCVVRVVMRAESAEISSTTCTCPVRLGCKHIVATVLTSNAAVEAAPISAAVREPATPRAPTWRVLLEPPSAGGSVPLALGVEVRHRGARGAHQ